MATTSERTAAPNRTSNRLEHGFRSSTVLLPTDNPAEYEALLGELTEHFGPADLTEDRFVREMTDAEWRLRRVRTSIASALARQMAKLTVAEPELDAIDLESRAVETLGETGCSYATWLRYESKFEHQYDRAYRCWSKYQDGRRRVSREEIDLSMKKAIAAPMPGAGPQRVPTRTANVSGQPVSNVQNIPNQQHPAPAQPAAAAPQGEASGLLIPARHGQSEPPMVQVPRNAPCPCNSGEKYKRCCGRTAVGIIHNRAA